MHTVPPNALLYSASIGYRRKENGRGFFAFMNLGQEVAHTPPLIQMITLMKGIANVVPGSITISYIKWNTMEDENRLLCSATHLCQTV